MNELSLAAAKDRLSRMLLSAYLDSFSVSSLQVSLRFINATIQPGVVLYVDTNFSCEASLRDVQNEKTDTSDGSFFTRRGKFLSDVYHCIGKEVSSVVLQSNGSFAISLGNSFISLELSQEDEEQEDSVWVVEMEAPPSNLSYVVKSVSCVPKGGEISFF